MPKKKTTMPPKKKKQVLGKGLSALISPLEPTKKANVTITNKPSTRNAPDSANQVITLDVNTLEPGQFQPREFFDEELLIELAASIQENGVLQPIIVRSLPRKKGKYQIIAGERRWRASKKAELTHIPAIIKELDDKDALEVALIENIQRQSLTPIEEAEGYKRLQQDFAYTQEQLAKELGKSRSHIANMLRILQLPDEIKALVATKQLSMGHARALISLKSHDAVLLAQKIIKRGLNVRQVEKLIASGKANANNPLPRKKRKSVAKENDIIELEQSIADKLGVKVEIDNAEDQGKIILHYANLEELDAILAHL